MTKNKKLQHLFIFFGFIVLLCLTYWPAISSYYFFHDDVIFFLRTYVRIGPPGTFFALAMGRFIGAFLFAGLSWIVNSIDDLKIVRFLSIAQLSVLGLMLTLWMKKYFFNLLQSKFLIVLLLTLPPFQIFACQAGMGQHPSSMIFVAGSFILAYGLSLSDSLQRRLFCVRAFFSILLFLSSLSVFQPGAMFYWALVGFVVLFEKEKSFSSLKQRIFNLFGIGFLSLILYRILLQFTSRFFTQFELYGYSPYELTTDIIGKFIWYFRDPVFHALNLWNVFAVKQYAFLTAIIILTGLGLSVFKNFQNKTKRGSKSAFFKIGTLSAVFFLCSLPNLVLPDNILLLRCFVGLWTVITFLLLWAVQEILNFFIFLNKKNFFTGIIVLLSVFGMIQARRTVWLYRVNLSMQETQFFLNFFKKDNIAEYWRIYIVNSDPRKFKTIADEYGNLTTFYEHNAYGLIATALREIFKEEFDIYHILVEHHQGEMLFLFSEKGQARPQFAYEVLVQSSREKKKASDFFEPTLVIDMSQFRPEPAARYFDL